MKNVIRLMAAMILLVLSVTGCEQQLAKETNVAPTGRSSARLSADAKARLEQMRAALPANAADQLKTKSALLLETHPEYREMVDRALGAVQPTPCNDNTALNQWLNSQLADWDGLVIFFAIYYGMLDIPTLDALFFENSSANQSFGVNGENTQRLTKTFKDTKRFWDIESTNMVMVPMHGSVLRDRQKLIRMYRLFGNSQATAEAAAADVLELMTLVPQYRNGDHPIFSFNAFAQRGFTFPPVGVIPDKIVMGDGIMQAYDAIGYGDIAPQAILAHEYGHHVQFQKNVFGPVPSPEATRRTELMADAFAAYFLSHSRGASMQWKRVQQFLVVFNNIGDCGFTSNGHHGTPTQRMAAAYWAYTVADNAQKQGHILPSQSFITLFDAQLSTLVLQ